jgi:DNA-directed RNA polymerase subunit RPC12/RpoP
VLGLWLGWVPFGVLVLNLQDTVLPPPWSAAAMFAYLAGFAMSGLRFGATPCPHCGHRFVEPMSLKFRSPWIWRCDHCGTKLGAPRS